MSSVKDGAGEEGSESQSEEGKDDGSPSYEAFQLPDGLTVADEDLTVFTDIASKHGMPQEAAQELIDLGVTVHENGRQSVIQEQDQAFEAQQSEWKQTLAQDPEIGGDNLPKTQEYLNAFEASKFAEPALFDVLKASGFDVHPEFVRLFARLGKLNSENSVMLGGNPGGGGKAGANKMFDNSDHAA